MACNFVNLVLLFQLLPISSPFPLFAHRHYLSSPKREAKSDQSRTEPSSCRSNLSSGTCNKATMPKSSLTESKSMTTLETKQQSLFSLPRQMRFVDKISLHKEMARFCNQQLNPTQLLQHKIAQPITLWSKSKGECNKNDIVDLLNQLKGTCNRLLCIRQKVNLGLPFLAMAREILTCCLR